MVVKDITKYSQIKSNSGDTVLEICSKDTDFSYKVHRHIQYPGTWFLTARELGIWMTDLETDDMTKALIEANTLIGRVLLEKIAHYSALSKEVGKHTTELLCPKYDKQKDPEWYADPPF